MSASAQPEVSLEKGVTGDDEVDALLSLGCGASLPSGNPLIHDLVSAVAHTTPDCIAIESGGEAITYGALEGWALRIASRLRATGIDRGDHVGLLVEPSTAMVAGVLGIVLAGAAYVPLDLAQPDRRIAEILADARGVGVLVSDRTRDRASGAGLPLFDVQDRTGTVPELAHVPYAVATDAAYLIATSGSTGEPKAVLVEHGHLAASTAARRAVYPGVHTFLLVSPLAFDSSAAGLWGTLTAGGHLVVATSDQARDPEQLLALIARHRVTQLLCIPSLYRVLLDAAERLGAESLRSLDTVIVAGESLDEDLVRRHFASTDCRVSLVNEYGPTEATVWASCHRFEGPGPVSIGVPVPGARLYVLDDEPRLVPRGTEGELFIGGAAVARGYFRKDDATARVFIDDPFADGDGSRMYRTGDLARWNAAGRLEFIGRRDHQIKIRGQRVEMGAVEAALRSAPGVDDAVVVLDRDRTRLIGFVVTSGSPAPEALRAHVAGLLPTAAVPMRIEIVEEFPRTLSGKIDRTALGARVDNDGERAPIRMARSGDVTTQVLAAWMEVLEIDHVPSDVNFFDLGGNSMQMFQLQDTLERLTGTRPSVVDLFRNTTVAAQIDHLRTAGTSSSTAGESRRAAVQRARAERARRQRGDRGPIEPLHRSLSNAADEP